MMEETTQKEYDALLMILRRQKERPLAWHRFVEYGQADNWREVDKWKQ